MKSIRLAGVCLSFLAGAAFAQAAPQPPGPGAAPPPPPPPADMEVAPPPPPPPPRGPAARFQIRHGDEIIDIKCADFEPSKVCVESVLPLLDRVAGKRP